MYISIKSNEHWRRGIHCWCHLLGSWCPRHSCWRAEGAGTGCFQGLQWSHQSHPWVCPTSSAWCHQPPSLPPPSGALRRCSGTPAAQYCTDSAGRSWCTARTQNLVFQQRAPLPHCFPVIRRTGYTGPSSWQGWSVPGTLCSSLACLCMLCSTWTPSCPSWRWSEGGIQGELCSCLCWCWSAVGHCQVSWQRMWLQTWRRLPENSGLKSSCAIVDLQLMRYLSLHIALYTQDFLVRILRRKD